MYRYDAPADQLRAEDAHRLVATLYAAKFPKVVKCVRAYAEALGQLRESKLAARTKDSLASPERIEATVRNVNWVP